MDFFIIHFKSLTLRVLIIVNSEISAIVAVGNCSSNAKSYTKSKTRNQSNHCWEVFWDTWAKEQSWNPFLPIREVTQLD